MLISSRRPWITPGREALVLEFFEVQAVDDFFGDADEVFDEERLGDEIFDAVDQRAEALFDVGATGHEEKGNVAGGLAAAQFFEELAAIEAGHFVVAEDDSRAARR